MSKLGAPELTRWEFLLALTVLVVNDHVLKQSELAGFVTGKLSDVAGLFLFPIFLYVILRLPYRSADRRARDLLAWACVTATAVVFAAVNTSSIANAWFTPYWGRVTLDVSDLWCLPMALAAGWWLTSSSTEQQTPGCFRRRTLELTVIIVTACACIATSPLPRQPRGYATWCVVEAQPQPDAERLPGRAWVSKSGKTGLGLQLEFSNRADRELTVGVRDARLRVFDMSSGDVFAEVIASTLPETATVGPRSAEQLYVPFEFDNERAWNEEMTEATVRLELAIDDQPVGVWVVELSHVYDGYHEEAVAPDEPRKGTTVAELRGTCPAIFEEQR